jgi:hypothetical protein
MLEFKERGRRRLGLFGRAPSVLRKSNETSTDNYRQYRYRDQ